MTSAWRTAGWLLALGLIAGNAHALVVTDSVKVNEVSYDPVANPETSSEYVELYNAGSTTAYLDGAVLTDEGNQGTNEATFQFPGTQGGTTIPLAAHAFMLLVGDATGSPFAALADFEFYGGAGDTDDPAVPNLVRTAGLASNLYLGNDGDGLTLSVGISNGSVIPCNEVVDGVSWEAGGTGDVTAMSASVCTDPAPHPGYTNGGSTGLMTLQRCPDGADQDRSAADFVATNRTPRAANLCNSIPPDISGLGAHPCFPTAGVPVTITCTVADLNQDLTTVQLFYKLDTAAGFDSVAMTPSSPQLYSTTLPGRSDQSQVLYYVTARDLMGNVVRSPSTAPGVPTAYRVGLQTIAALQAPAVNDSCAASSQAGKACNVVGVVTHVAYEYSASFFYIQQGTGPNSGLRVFTVVDSSFVPQFGDSVRVSGVLGEFHCQTEVVLAAGCGTILGHNRKVRARTLASLADVSKEENESMLVKLQGPFDVASGFDDTNWGKEFAIGSGSEIAYVGDDTFYPDGIGYSPVPVPGMRLDAITGIVGTRRVDTTPVPRANPGILLRLEPRRDNDVNVIWSGTGEPGPQVAGAFGLQPNTPNPFNPVTTLEFTVPAGGRVRVTIHDARGQRVRTLVDRDFPAPAHDRIRWDGCDDAGRPVPAGVYFCTLAGGGDRATRKMLLLK
jgi:hypothetical protein